MMRRLDRFHKRKPAPAGNRSGQKFEKLTGNIECSKTTENVVSAQALAGSSGELDLYDAGRTIDRGPSETSDFAADMSFSFRPAAYVNVRLPSTNGGSHE